VTVRHVLIALNLLALVAIAAYLVWAVLSPKRASEEIEPANVTPFLPDEDLESRRLERVQGWALLFAAVVAIALPLYWLHEPSRQRESVNYFDKNSAERGKVLFSDPTMESFDPTVSLQCARCHGSTGGGGTVNFTLPNGDSVIWHAPPLNTVLLRFTEDPKCVDPDLRPTLTCSVTNIITYGRPGTPMPAWGVAGGGAKNDQAIQDLVAFLRTIQLSPAQAQKQAADDLGAAKSAPADAVKAARDTLATDQKTLDTALAAARKAFGRPDATEADVTGACNQIAKDLESGKGKVERAQGQACRDYTTAQTTVQQDQKALAWTEDWAARRANVSDGQLLFELNCARCHTAGWSTFDPTVPPDQPGGLDSVGLPGGGGGAGGGIGFNLRDMGEIRRFGTDVDGGFDSQVSFVTDGSLPNKEYGNNGLGTGKMPGFGRMLTSDMIKEIVGYERYCLDSSVLTSVEPACSTDLKDLPREAPTTTTKTGGSS
jgi:mono/diheme cytochrome c family protein